MQYIGILCQAFRHFKILAGKLSDTREFGGVLSDGCRKVEEEWLTFSDGCRKVRGIIMSTLKKKLTLSDGCRKVEGE